MTPRSSTSEPAAVAAWALLARFAAYAAVVALTFQAMVVAMTAVGSAAAVAEHGPVENVQLGLTLLASLLFLTASARSTSTSRAFVFVGLLCAFVAVRELDRFFDVVLWHGAWKLVAAPVLIAAVYVAWGTRSRLSEELVAFVRTPAFHLLFFGFTVLIVYAQVVGQKELWQAVMDEHYLRNVKDAVEETTELLGYLVIVFASVEATLQACHDTRE